MKRRHARTLASVFGHPADGNIPRRDIEALLIESGAGWGAEISERKGSRIGVSLCGGRRVFHLTHAEPDTDKGAVASIRDWLRRNGMEP